MEVTAIIPTLGRPSLEEARKSLENQTLKPFIIIKDGDRDTLIKIKEGVNEATTEFIAIADDDAKYPEHWLENLSKAMSANVGFVGGPCLPWITDSSNDAERCIGEVTASFFGTSNMSYRAKARGKTREADETNLIGNGLYRREVFARILNEEFEKIPPAAWETYVFTRVRQLNFRTLYNPQGAFYHKQRSDLLAFSRQIFRSGMGRMNFFKSFPSEFWTRFWMLFPTVFFLYLLGLVIAEWNGIAVNSYPLLLYVAGLLLVSYGFNKHKSKALPLYYLTMHLAYGLGMLYGVVKNERTWT